MATWLNRGDPYWPLCIDRAERQSGAVYVGDFCVKQAHGWTEEPVAVFWNEDPPDPSYSQYFGLFVRSGVAIITGAGSAAEGHWNGLVADDGEVIYSRYRHDYRTSKDGSVSVDGGRDYFKRSGTVHNAQVRITLVRDRLVVNETLFLPTSPPG